MKKLIIFLLFLLPGLAFSQTRSYDISWEKNDSMIYFSHASFSDHHILVPHFTKSIPWPHEGLLPKVSVDVNKSSAVDPIFLEKQDLSPTGYSPRVTYELVYEKKRPVLQINVRPFFTNPVSGQIEKIESFSIDIQTKKPISALKSTSSGQYAAASKLASHSWYKIGILESGIHKLSYEQLVNMGLSNPATAKIFGAGAILLPEDYSKGSYDDLREIPVHIEKGSDQLFGPGDYILFYARGPVSWNYDMASDFYSHTLHNYAMQGFYFVTDGLGVPSQPANAETSTDAASSIVTSYDILDFLEDKKYNLLNSGKEWYGDQYSITLSGAYPFTLNGLITTESVKIRVAAAGRSNVDSDFTIKANNTTLGQIPVDYVNQSKYTYTYARENSIIYSYNASQSVVTVSVEYNQPNSNAIGWLNHITLNGRAGLAMNGDQLSFRDSRSASFGSVSEFRMQGADSDTRIWEITSPEDPANIPFSLNSGTATFKLETDDIREFIAFDIKGSFPSPETEGTGLGKIENQNLHAEDAPDMIIIYDEMFEEQVARLVEHRAQHDGLSITSVTQEQVFNEFSSGTRNVSAIRNYLKMHYDRTSPEDMTKYLLLFGDGSFDNKDTASYNPNLIITYQSDESLQPTGSYVSDDFYGLLDTGEDMYYGALDIGIGRLPVSSPEEAELVIDKIIAYDQPETLGEWRNYICFIGDDEDGNTHMRQANALAKKLEANYPHYNINKIFLDAFPQETTPTGDLYPAVTQSLNEQMSKGALIINYTGHGGVTGLAHERILDITNIKAWDNEGKLPLFMTATCEFSRYDEYNYKSKSEATTAGEEVLLNPVGGSIALFTTTRLVYSSSNQVLNSHFYDIVFEKDSLGQCYRLGDIIAYSKNNAGNGINRRNFTLLGDPSMILAFPENVVVTDSINQVSTESLTDTISALEFVTINGHIETVSGEMFNSFNGTITPIVYDKMKNLVTLANDGGKTMEFQSRNSVLYKGKATVTNGAFEFSFFIPKDINYSIGTGKISYYSENGTDDAHGSLKEIIIGGLGDLTLSDTAGPDIRVFMNDSLFKTGGITTASPELLIYIDDDFGINTTGNGIGHDITATLDDDRINSIILNGYYQAEIDQYASGSVRYPYKSLETGRHTISVKVWDIFNNSAQRNIEFVVVESSAMLLSEIYNYPNPFIDQTWFNVEHNRPGQQLEVVIRIYDMQGALATVLSDITYTPGYRMDPIPWNGRGYGGATLGGGLYVYKVYVKSETGEEAVGSGRLIIKR